MIPMETIGLMSATGLIILETLKGLWPSIEGNRARAISIILGPVIGVAFWLLELTPLDTNWKQAVVAGIVATVGSNGAYSLGKGLGKKSAKPPHVVRIPRPKVRSDSHT